MTTSTNPNFNISLQILDMPLILITSIGISPASSQAFCPILSSMIPTPPFLIPSSGNAILKRRPLLSHSFSPNSLQLVSWTHVILKPYCLIAWVIASFFPYFSLLKPCRFWLQTLIVIAWESVLLLNFVSSVVGWPIRGFFCFWGSFLGGGDVLDWTFWFPLRPKPVSYPIKVFGSQYEVSSSSERSKTIPHICISAKMLGGALSECSLCSPRNDYISGCFNGSTSR